MDSRWFKVEEERPPRLPDEQTMATVDWTTYKKEGKTGRKEEEEEEQGEPTMSTERKKKEGKTGAAKHSGARVRTYTHILFTTEHTYHNTSTVYRKQQ